MPGCSEHHICAGGNTVPVAVSQEESVEITQAEVLPEATVVFAGSPAAAARGEAPLKSHPKDKKDDQGSVLAQ